MCCLLSVERAEREEGAGSWEGRERREGGPPGGRERRDEREREREREREHRHTHKLTRHSAASWALVHITSVESAYGTTVYATRGHDPPRRPPPQHSRCQGHKQQARLVELLEKRKIGSLAVFLFCRHISFSSGGAHRREDGPGALHHRRLGLPRARVWEGAARPAAGLARGVGRLGAELAQGGGGLQTGALSGGRSRGRSRPPTARRVSAERAGSVPRPRKPTCCRALSDVVPSRLRAAPPSRRGGMGDGRYPVCGAGAVGRAEELKS